MNVEVLVVPYDSGHRAVRMGRGPDHFLEHGFAAELEGDGHHVRVTRLHSELDPPTEVAVAFDLARSIARSVRSAAEQDAFPIVLAGNCFSAIGTVAGLGPESTGVLWLDAHGDLNTPETTRSGFLDGMAAATLIGRCWRGLAATVPGFSPIDDARLALVGVRDLDPEEENTLQRSGVQRVGVATVRGHPQNAIEPLAAAMSQHVSRFYLHVDLDVLDPEVARANGFAAPDGLRVDEVAAVATAAARHRALAAVAFTAVDPSVDEDGRAVEAAIRIARAILPA